MYVVSCSRGSSYVCRNGFKLTQRKQRQNIQVASYEGKLEIWSNSLPPRLSEFSFWIFACPLPFAENRGLGWKKIVSSGQEQGQVLTPSSHCLGNTHLLLQRWLLSLHKGSCVPLAISSSQGNLVLLQQPLPVFLSKGVEAPKKKVKKEGHS